MKSCNELSVSSVKIEYTMNPRLTSSCNESQIKIMEKGVGICKEKVIIGKIFWTLAYSDCPLL